MMIDIIDKIKLGRGLVVLGGDGGEKLYFKWSELEKALSSMWYLNKDKKELREKIM